MVIKDSSMSAGPIWVGDNPGPDAILLESVRDASINSVHVNGGFSGVNFASCGFGPGCPPLTDQLPSTGEVKNCTFANNWWGVVLVNAADITVRENVISGANQGLRVGFLDILPPANVSILGNELFSTEFAIISLLLPTGPPGFPGPIFGCRIKDNQVHDNTQGIALVNRQNCVVSENLVENNARLGIALFTASSENKVSQNTVTGSTEFFGIGLIWNLDNPPLGGPTGNLISENTVTGNSAFDLFHSELSTPNKWRENVFNTKSGADIP